MGARKSRKSVSLLPPLFLTDSSFQEDVGAPSPLYLGSEFILSPKHRGGTQKCGPRVKRPGGWGG